MKFIIRLLVILAILALLGFGGYKAQGWLAERNKPRFKTAKVETGDLRISVNASGEVNPVLKVKVGSFVSGPILKLHVDYNTEVKAGDPLADIDPRIYDANVARAARRTIRLHDGEVVEDTGAEVPADAASKRG